MPGAMTADPPAMSGRRPAPRRTPGAHAWRPVRLLTFSTLYPNAAHPTLGVFVENRLRHLVASGEAESTVLAPVPWFPSRRPPMPWMQGGSKYCRRVAEPAPPEVQLGAPSSMSGATGGQCSPASAVSARSGGRRCDWFRDTAPSAANWPCLRGTA